MRRLRSVLIAVILFGTTVTLASGATLTAFSSTSAISGNAIQAGTVALTDSDSGSATITVTNAKQGAVSSGCYRVTYAGTLTSTVRLHASSSGALVPYLNLKIERGTGGSPLPSCTGFSVDTTNHRGLGAGVLFDGALAAMPATAATGIDDPDASWGPSTNHVYRLIVTVATNDAIQNTAATANLAWTATNA